MQPVGCGVWEAFSRFAQPGQRYKLCIKNTQKDLPAPDRKMPGRRLRVRPVMLRYSIPEARTAASAVLPLLLLFVGKILPQFRPLRKQKNHPKLCRYCQLTHPFLLKKPRKTGGKLCRRLNV